MPKEDIIYCTTDWGKPEPFKLSLAGITYPTLDYKIFRKCSEISVVEYVVNGKGVVFVDGKRYDISAGDTYILPKGRSHEYFSDQKNPWEKVWMNISGPLTSELLSVYGLVGKVQFKKADTSKYFFELFDFCKKTSDKSSLNGKAAICFHEILQTLSKTESADENSIAIKAQQFIDSNIYKKITAANVSQNIGISVSRLGQIFKQTYGQTVWAYILSTRLKISENLLKNTNMQIKEIAEKLQFSDEHYFSNLFKSKYGISPSKYRKEQ